MSAIRSAIALLPALWLGACSSDSGESQATGVAHALSAASEAGSGVLESIQSPRAVLHGGVRVFEVFDALGPNLAYRESILTDGQGQFSQRPIEALTPVGGAWFATAISRHGKSRPGSARSVCAGRGFGTARLGTTAHEVVFRGVHR